MSSDPEKTQNNGESNGIITSNPVTGKPLKVTVVGDGTVGKTCLLISHTTGQFPLEYVPTVFDNYNHDQKVDGTTYRLTLWDTAGQEEYEKLRPLSYPGTSVFIVCFSLNSKVSFQNISKKWLPELKECCPGVPILLVGTKMDVRDSNAINPKDGAKLVKKERLLQYLECSSKTSEGVNQVFESAAKASVGLLKRTKTCVIL